MGNTINLNKDQVLAKKGDRASDLYYVTSGKLMICSRSGHMVTAIAYLAQGQYFGELSFFDSCPRSADVIAIEPSSIVKIPSTELKKQFPTWLLIVAKQMTKKIRLMDEVISEKGIKRTNVHSIKPLSIEEQRHYFEVLDKSQTE